MFFRLEFVPMKALKLEYEKLRKYILNNDILDIIAPILSDFHNSFGKNIDNLSDNNFLIFSADFWSVSDRIIKNVKKTNNVV